MRTETQSRPLWRLALAGVVSVTVASTCAAVWGPVLGAHGRTDRGVAAAPAASTTTTTSPAPATTVSPTTTVSPAPTTTTTTTTTTASTAVAARGGDEAFLACVRHRESRGRYDVVNPDSGAGGAYQFLATTWNNTARHAGRWDLVGVAPQHASVADQDAMARHLLGWYGRSPWAHPTLPC